jgi:hypothetical protein
MLVREPCEQYPPPLTAAWQTFPLKVAAAQGSAPCWARTVASVTTKVSVTEVDLFIKAGAPSVYGLPGSVAIQISPTVPAERRTGTACRESDSEA